MFNETDVEILDTTAPARWKIRLSTSGLTLSE